MTDIKNEIDSHDERDKLYNNRLRPLLQGTTAKPWEKVKKTLRKWLSKSPMKGLTNLMMQDGMWLYPLTHVYR